MNLPLWHFWIRLPLYTVLGLIGLLMNPFGISDITDQASQDAFYRVIAPTYDRHPYNERARNEIVVVLIDENAIAQMYERHAIGANEWPLLYSDHGAILERILAFDPRAVFADIYFKKERSTDGSFNRMLRRLQRAEQRHHAPVIFAGGYADEVPSPIQRKLAKVGTLSVNGWQDFGSAYPLRLPGRNQVRDTVAYQLYRIACLGENPRPGCARPLATNIAEGTALSVRWGSAPARPVLPEYVNSRCDDTPGTLPFMVRETVLGMLTGLVGGVDDELRVRCPYHQTLFAHELMHIARDGSEEERRQLSAALKDRIVLLGITLEGLHDNVVSPVHGLIPSVMLHAMALDNLMVYGAGFTRAADDFLDWINYGAWFVVVLIVCSVLYLIERWEQARPGGETPGAHSRKLVYVTALGAVIVLSLLMFAVLNYEPINSIGFLGIAVLVGEMVHGGTSERLIGLFMRYRHCVRTNRRSLCWFRCLWTACKGGAKDAQATTG